MKYNKIFTAPFRRKKEGRTDYKRRLVLLKSKLPRLVVRRSNKHMMVQLIEYDGKGDRTLFTVKSSDLKKYGWEMNTGNMPSAYLTGLLLGVRAKGKKAILDLGLQAPIKGARLYAALKGAIDGGLDVTSSEENLPSDERITGKHISQYAVQLGQDYEKRFSGYAKKAKDARKFEEEFEKTKQSILKNDDAK
jgi:large subunit ribosomal protein L18